MMDVDKIPGCHLSHDDQFLHAIHRHPALTNVVFAMPRRIERPHSDAERGTGSFAYYSIGGLHTALHGINALCQGER